MTYAPDIFTPAGGLSRPVVLEWVTTNDETTIARWLASGNPHPRLATEAIAHAVTQNNPERAEQIWQAGWHRPIQVFQSSWSNLIRIAYGSFPERTTFDHHHARGLEWLVNKSMGAGEGKNAGQQNASRIMGLEFAAKHDRPELWKQLLKGTDCGVAAAQALLQDLKPYMAWWPNPFTSDFRNEPRTLLAEWAQQQALPDLLEHGLKPGGSVWVGAMEKEEASYVFNLLLSHAERITTPRQRAAILLYAEHQGVLQERFKQTFNRFLDLGFPTAVKLTAAEAKKATTPDARLALVARDAEHDANSWAHRYFNRDPLFQNDWISFKEPLLSQVHARLRAGALDNDLPAPKPSSKGPRF